MERKMRWKIPSSIIRDFRFHSLSHTSRQTYPHGVTFCSSTNKRTIAREVSSGCLICSVVVDVVVVAPDSEEFGDETTIGLGEERNLPTRTPSSYNHRCPLPHLSGRKFLKLTLEQLLMGLSFNHSLEH